MKETTSPRYGTECAAVIAACRRMNVLGINQGKSGNVSCRINQGFLISPSGIAYDDLSPDQIVEMDLEGGYFGDWLPSSEWRMHMDIYRSRPEAGAVVHTHPTYATALSCLRRDVPAFHYMIAMMGGATLRCAKYATFGTADLSANMLKALEDRNACLLANHGAICFAEALDKAVDIAAELETLCRQYAIVSSLGEPAVLDDEEMGRVLRLFQAYGRQPGESPEDADISGRSPVRRDNPAR